MVHTACQGRPCRAEIWEAADALVPSTAYRMQRRLHTTAALSRCRLHGSFFIQHMHAGTRCHPEGMRHGCHSRCRPCTQAPDCCCRSWPWHAQVTGIAAANTSTCEACQKAHRIALLLLLPEGAAAHACPCGDTVQLWRPGTSLTRKEASLTLVPKPNAGSDGLVLLTWDPNPLRSILVLGSGCLLNVLPLSIVGLLS
jgi:hypothetical protein